MSITSGAYLAHHGRLGQKWGKRNGPPYPLDYSSLSSEERSKAKDSAIRNGNVREANANKKYFTDQEINALLARFDLNKKLSNIAAAQVKSGKDQVDAIFNDISKLTDWGNKASNFYNMVAKYYNTFGEGYMKPITPDGGKKGNQNQNDNQKKKS